MKIKTRSNRTGLPACRQTGIQKTRGHVTRGNPVVPLREGPEVKEQPFLHIGSDEWTAVPNEVFDIIMSRITPAQFKVLLIIIRLTHGWQKDADQISKGQLMKLTGLTKQGVRNCLEALGDIILARSNGPRTAQSYSLNKEWRIPEAWSNKLPSKLSIPSLVNSVDQPLVNSVAPPKKDTKKRKKPSSGLAIFSKATAVHSDHKQFIEWWCTTYLERFNVPYLVTGQCAKTAQSLLKRYSLPRLKETAQALLDSTDPFLIQRGKTIPTLYSEWNRLEQHRVKLKPKDDIPEFLG